MVDKNTWPPGQLKAFTPLLLINYYQDRCTPEQVTTMAELMCSGNVDKIASITYDQSTDKHLELDSNEKLRSLLGTSTTTKEIKEILAPLENSEEPCFILVEGAPGIGKSVLLKEIAYKWAKTELLQKFELVLLVCLRDPSLQQVKSINDLLHLFYKGDSNATEIVSVCSQYLSENGGKNLTLLLDGYDECPGNLLENSLIAYILQRQILPLCGLVVSSRPHASEHLREQVTIRVDILGFTETEREHYIKQALPNQPHKIKELTQYLHQQPSIDSVCFIPFNMVILLYLYKMGISLPKNSTELYKHFICSTICRHISKMGNSLRHNLMDLNNLPEPYSTVIKQLSMLSLKALNSNKLIFTLDDILAACPGIESIPGGINGFGLLQAVQYFGLYTKIMSLNFIHFTIQEFLAAYCVSQLPPNEELKIIKANFWRNTHFNMFSIYVSLTKGQQYAFKTFLSGGSTAIVVAPKFLKHQLKSLRLYFCFNEANDHTICSTIEQADIFCDKKIELLSITLAASDLECISIFLTSSHIKKWVKLNLYNCHIQDKGLNILYRGLRFSSNITIEELWLRYNGLTAQSSCLIGELVVKCKVKLLMISGNFTIGEDEQLYSMLTNPSSILEELYMTNTKLSSRSAVSLFTALKKNDTLKILSIRDNSITDDAIDTITAALKWNNCLVKLSLHGNPLSNEAMLNIAQCLEVNNTLQSLGIPDCPQGVQENIKSIEEAINKKRKNQGCQDNLEIKYSLVY